MPNEHPLITTRRILQVAVADQLELANEAKGFGYTNTLGKGIAEQIARNANAEAGRLVSRLVAIQERIEEHDLD